MSEFMESTGKTVDEAVREALLRMGLRREEVEVTVIQKDRGGFMGVGRRQAVVRVEKKAGGGRGSSRGRRGGGTDGGRGERLDDGRGRGSRGGRRSASGRGREQDGRGRDQDGRGREQGGRGRDQGGRGRDQDGRGREQSGRGREQGGRGRDQSGRGRDQSGRGRDQSGRGRDQSGRGRDQGGRGRRQDGEAAQQETTTRRQDENTRNPVSGDQRNDRENRRDEPGGEGRRRRRSRRRRKPAAEVEAAVSSPAGDGKIFGDEQSGARVPETSAPETSAPETSAPETSAPETRSNDRQEVPAAEVENKPAEAAAPAAPEPVDETVPVESGEFLVGGQKARARIEPFTEADTDPLAGFLEQVATRLMVKAGFPCRVQVKEDEYHQVKMVVDDRSAGVLIGRHGATVDAVESLVEKIASHTVGDRVRMNLDINNYRLRQHDSVEERARNAAAEARNTGEPVPMAPMHGRERRLVHLEVEEMDDLVTYTVDGPDGKFVMICREDQVPSDEAVAPAPAVEPDPAPMSDAVAVSAAARESGEIAAVITDDVEDIDDDEPRSTED